MSIPTNGSYATEFTTDARARVRPVALVAVLVFLVSTVFYGLCLYPGLGGEINAGDSAKFQILGHTPIMVHGPGYPLVLALGELVRALDLPFAPWWVLTFALSAVPAAIANAMAFLILRRVTGNFTLALAGALLLGTATLMAIQATEAEVYALNIAFLLTILYLLLLFTQTMRAGFFVAASAVYAFSFGNHLMMIMLLPLFVWLTVRHHHTILRRGPVIAILAFVLLGASQYLYLAWVAHDPRTSYSEYMPLPPTAWRLIEYIAGVHFQSLYGSGFGSTKNIVELLKTFHAAHPWISVPLVAAGLLVFVRRWERTDAAWRGVALLLGAALCFMPFMLGYGPFDIQAFHLPVLAPVLLAAVAALGLALRQHPTLMGGLAALLLAVGVVRAAQTAAELGDREPRFAGLKETVRELVAQAPVEMPFVAMGYELRMAALYYQLRGELPRKAIYRLAWRTPEQIHDQPLVGGVVVPSDQFTTVRRIEERRPDMDCRVELVARYHPAKWPAYTFRCQADPQSPDRRSDPDGVPGRSHASR